MYSYEENYIMSLKTNKCWYLVRPLLKNINNQLPSADLVLLPILQFSRSNAIHAIPRGYHKLEYM